MDKATRGWLEGPRIIAAVILGLALMTTLGTSTAGVGREGALWLTVATTRTSLLLFLLTFSASAINGLLSGLRSGRPGKWLLRNRRFFGLSFTASHLLHAFAFLWLSSTREQSLPEMIGLPAVIVLSSGYVVLAALSLTSFDAAVRLLGRSRWTILHRTGMYALFSIFLFSYLGRAARGDVLSALSLVALLAALGLRIANRLRLRRARAARR
ncbi:MAG: hypothetical protein AAGF11_23950 [Myxococcota bacterium]